MTQKNSAAAFVGSRRFEERLGVLGNPRFRLYWGSMFASFLANQMQLVVQGWLVLELTNSPLYLGLVGGAAGLPIIVFSLFGGTMADRMERRKLLIFCQLAITCLKLALTFLVLTGQVRVWHVILMAMGLGVAMSFNDPARQAFVTELVKKEEFLNAISLTTAAMNITRIGGPVVAGALIAALGIGGTYVVNTSISLLAAVTLVPIPSSTGGFQARQSTVWSNVVEGISFVRRNKTVLWVLGATAMPTMFGPMANGLMPVFARDILKVGAPGLGQLMGAVGVGALVGSVAIASAGNMKHKGLLFLGGGILWCIATITFSLSSLFPLSLAALAVQGVAMSSWSASSVTLLQTHTPNELRGRIMGLYLIAMQASLLAQVLGGIIATATSVPFAGALGGSLALMMMFVPLLATPVVRRLE